MMHPFKFLKKILPQTLFARAAMIVILPVIFVQLTTTYVFVDRHLSKVTKMLASSLAGEMAATVDMVHSTPDALNRWDEIQDYAQLRYGLFIKIKNNIPSMLFEPQQNLSTREEILHTYLKSHLKDAFHLHINDEFITVRVATLKGLLTLKVSTKRLFSRTTPIFFWWAAGTPILFLLIAILFLRNQVRPIRRLAQAVEAFGKGARAQRFRPSGAYEIRLASQAFLDMRDRIERQMRERTEMLAGVSHDLRTPLTRMELQLALMDTSQEVTSLQEEIKEMSRMIDAYMAFARGEEGEKAQEIMLSSFFAKLIKKIDTSRVEVMMDQLAGHTLYGRKQALKRLVTNLIQNGLQYAPRVWVTAFCEEDDLHLIVEDNGPGIPASQYEAVFRPFYRLEASRNTATGGTGLGLAIVKDIVTSHGGTIDLDTSRYGGLKVHVCLPLLQQET
ncbi:MAG: ATP-binding protein [Holosporales bacterium]